MTKQPIIAKIAPLRQGAARHYGVHPYFTRRPWNVVAAYIKHFSEEGGLVLDPFGGSGVTAIESLILKRRTIHVDINPLANFITEQIAVAPINLAGLSDAFGRLKERCRHELSNWKDRSEQFFEDHPVPYWYPRGRRLPQNADAEFVEELFTRRQLFALSLIFDRINSEKDATFRKQLLLCFSATLAKTNRTFISAQNRAVTRGGPTIFSVYRYAIPPNPVELDVWEQFAARFRNLMVCKRETNRFIGDFHSPINCKIIRGSAATLYKFIKPGTVDYVFTDPPYGGHIAYLDLSSMWNAWLNFELSSGDKDAEIIVGGDANHSQEHYTNLLSNSINQIAQTLKPNGWLSLVFEHKDTGFYRLIIETAADNGLLHVNTVSQSLDVIWSMHKKKNPMTVLAGELILNFQKTKPKNRTLKTIDPLDVSTLVQRVAKEEIARSVGVRTEDIFNIVMVRCLNRQSLSSALTLDIIVDTLLKSGLEFNRKTGLWTSKKEAEIQKNFSF